jgi:hypothetical protein
MSASGYGVRKASTVLSQSYISALMKAEIKKGSARDSKASLEPFAILAPSGNSFS